jgi:hypothetical protein
MPVVDTAEGGDRVDQQQGRMLDTVNGLADFGDRADHPGGGLVVHHAHRLDGPRRVSGEPLRDDTGVHSVPPVAGNEVDDKPQLAGHLSPQRREMSSLEG